MDLSLVSCPPRCMQCAVPRVGVCGAICVTATHPIIIEGKIIFSSMKKSIKYSDKYSKLFFFDLADF